MKVKGVSLRTILEAIEAVYGKAALDAVHAALPGPIRAQIEPMILASSFYPVEVSAAIHEAVRAELGAGGTTANRRIGAEAARRDFGGIYRIFIRVMDEKRLLGGLDRAWRQYNSAGVVEWPTMQPGEAHGVVREVDGFSEAMWHSIAGRLETILLLGGAKHATVTVKSWAATEVAFAARWSV